MKFDKTEPKPSTKLRNAPTLLSNNFTAIQEADSSFIPQAVNLAARTALGIGNDPSAIVDTVITYSKQDASGDPQLYTIDPSSIVTQLTGGSLTAASDGRLVLPNGLIVIWGSFNVTISWVAYTFPVAFPNNAFYISGNKYDPTASAIRNASISFAQLTTTNVKIASGSFPATVKYIAIGN